MQRSNGDWLAGLAWEAASPGNASFGGSADGGFRLGLGVGSSVGFPVTRTR